MVTSQRNGSFNAKKNGLEIEKETKDTDIHIYKNQDLSIAESVFKQQVHIHY